jgi:hypothetical protein
MSDTVNPGRAKPQSVVGPITLGRKHSGKTITIEPNSVLGPDALSAALGGSTISLISAASTAAAGIAIVVTCNGATQTIEITGESVDGPTTTFPSGTLLYAIARTESDIVLLSANDSETTYVTFPIGSGTVTANLGGSGI